MKLKLNNKIYILIVFSLALISVFHASIFKKTVQLEKEKRFWSKELVQFIIPEIVIDGKRYTITEGNVFSVEAPSLKREVSVLRVGYYSLLTRIDPMFAVPETDIKALRKSILLMEESFDNFGSYYYPQEEKKLRKNFYPIDFLYSIAVLEEARRDVIERPSDKNIEIYDMLLHKTINIYQKNLKRMRSVYAQLREHKVFTLPTVSVSNETYITFLDFLINSVRGIERKRISRADCFKGNIKSCPTASYILSPFLHLPTASEQVGSGIVPEFIKNNASLIRNYYSVLNIPDQENMDWYRAMPIVVLSESACALENDVSYYTVMPQNYLTEAAIPRLVLLNDLYFHASKNQEKPLQLALQKKTQGPFPLLYQPMPTPYFCPDYGADFAKVMTILKIRSLLSEYGGFSQNTMLTKLQRKITSGDVIYEDDVVELLNTLSFLYQAQKSTTVLNNGDSLFVERLLTLYHSKTGYAEQLILSIMGYNKFLPTLALLGAKVDFYDLFILYSAPSSTYLSFNESIIKNIPPLITRKENNLEKNGLISFKKDVENLYSYQDIVEIIKKSDLIMYTRGVRNHDLGS